MNKDRSTVIIEFPQRDRTEHAFNLMAAVRELGAAATSNELAASILALRETMKCDVQIRYFDKHVLNLCQTMLIMERELAKGGEPVDQAYEAWKSIQMLGIMAQSGGTRRIARPLYN